MVCLVQRAESPIGEAPCQPFLLVHPSHPSRASGHTTTTRNERDVTRRPYAARVAASVWAPRSLFSGTNLLATNVAPWGSAITVILTHGASNGATRTVPPSSVARSAVASASSTPNVTLQLAGTSGSPSAIGLSAATTSAKPSGAPLCVIRSRRPGSL